MLYCHRFGYLHAYKYYKLFPVASVTTRVSAKVHEHLGDISGAGA